MKRDLDLLRDILIRIEDTDLSENRLSSSDFSDLGAPDFSPYDVSQHIMLLADNGYIEISAIKSIGMKSPKYQIKRITSAGYDYLDSVRDAGVWSEVKRKLSSAGASFTLDIVKSVATAIIQNRLGV